MTSINQVLLVGNLARDGEIRTMRDGETKLLNFSIATNRRYKDRNGDWKDAADYHRCVAWFPNDGLVEKMRKGAGVLVQGRLQTRSWEDAKGEKRYATEVITTGKDVTVLSNPLEKGKDGSWQRPPVKAESGDSWSGSDIPFALIGASGIALAFARILSGAF